MVMVGFAGFLHVPNKLLLSNGFWDIQNHFIGLMHSNLKLSQRAHHFN